MVRPEATVNVGPEATSFPQRRSARTSWPRQVGELAFRHPAGPACYENLPEPAEQDCSRQLDAGAE